MWELCEENEDDKKELRAQKIKYIRANLELISDDDLPELVKLIDVTKKNNENKESLYIEYKGQKIPLQDYNDVPNEAW